MTGSGCIHQTLRCCFVVQRPGLYRRLGGFQDFGTVANYPLFLAAVPVWREYFRLVTVSGLLVDVYRDMAGGGWYVQRVYD
jgi:hypothetical protein